MNAILIFAVASILTIAASVGLPVCVLLAIVALQKDQAGSKIGTVMVVLAEAIAIGFPLYVAAWFGRIPYQDSLPQHVVFVVILAVAIWIHNGNYIEGYVVALLIVLAAVWVSTAVRAANRKPVPPRAINQMHHKAHEECFIANSVRTRVLKEPFSNRSLGPQ